MLIFSSIFLQDFKAVVYISGLLLACFIAVIAGNNTTYESENLICKTITLSKDKTTFSKLPLSIVTLTYTFFYLVYIIASNNLSSQNIPTLVLFPIIILSDIIWNWYNSCYQTSTIIGAVVIGSSIGVLWSYIITSTNMPNLLYFNAVSNSEVCSRPSQQTFRCSVFKNGELISSN
jgi:hypothetical protein